MVDLSDSSEDFPSADSFSEEWSVDDAELLISQMLSKVLLFFTQVSKVCFISFPVTFENPHSNAYVTKNI